MAKTFEQVLDLKRNWHFDPCFDIEDTEGFEEHHAELLEYRLRCEAEWDRQRKLELDNLSERLGLPGNHRLAREWQRMESRMAELETRIRKLEGNYE